MWDIVKAVGLAILLLILLRDTLTWFWKQSAILKELQKINKSLDAMLNKENDQE